MRFFQGVTALGLVAAITLVIILTELTIPDLFACVLAFIATGWGILCVRFCDTENKALCCAYNSKNSVFFVLSVTWTVTSIFLKM